MRHAERWCGLNDERSFVDPVTNIGVLAWADAQTIGGFLRGTLHGAALPSLLHETTHSMCGLSPVGTALSVLYLRACSETSSGRFPERRLAVISRYCQAVTILRPIAEGLAVLAEFDLTPDETPRDVVLPLTIAGLYAVLQTSRELQDRHLAMSLTHTRLTAETVERKAGLYTLPYTVSDGGYLAGYLFLRKLWSAAVREDSAFASPSTFLLHVSFWFFRDYRLVALLLDETTEHTNLSDVLTERIASRATGFVKGLFVRRVLLEQHRERVSASVDLGNSSIRTLGRIAATDSLRNPVLSFSDDDASVVANDMATFSRAIQDVRQDAKIGGYAEKLFRERSWLWLVSHPAAIKENTVKVTATVANICQLTLPRLGTTNGAALGWINVLYSMTDHCQVVAIGSGSTVLGMRAVGLLRDEEKTDLIAIIGDRESRLGADEGIAKALRESKAALFSTLTLLVQSAGERLLDALARYSFPQDLDHSTRSAMMRRGLLPALQSPSATRALAVISLAAANRAPLGYAERILEMLSIDPGLLQSTVVPSMSRLGYRVNLAENYCEL